MPEEGNPYVGPRPFERYTRRSFLDATVKSMSWSR
jgi:hypothetical protein